MPSHAIAGGGHSTAGGRRLARPTLFLVNLAVFCLLVTVIELGAHLFFPRQLEGLFNDPQVFIRKRPFVVPHQTRGLALKPGYDAGGYRINAAGFRGPELPADLEGCAVVLLLGESSTFGWLVEQEDTYPAHLQRILDDASPGRRTVVVNAGVPSYTSAQVRLYLEELLQHFRPAVVLVSVLWNDALFACIDNWMPELLIIQQPRPWRQFLLRHSATYRALALRPPRAGPAKPSADNPESLRFYARNLADMARTCNRQGVPLLLLRPSVDVSHVPVEGMKIWRRTIERQSFIALLEEFGRSLDQAASEGDIPVVPHRLSRSERLYNDRFLDPVHLNGEGNRLLAEDIASYLLQNGLVASSQRRLDVTGQ